MKNFIIPGLLTILFAGCLSNTNNPTTDDQFQNATPNPPVSYETFTIMAESTARSGVAMKFYYNNTPLLQTNTLSPNDTNNGREKYSVYLPRENVVLKVEVFYPQNPNLGVLATKNQLINREDGLTTALVQYTGNEVTISALRPYGDDAIGPIG